MSTTMEQHALAAGMAFPWHEVYTPNLSSTLDFYTQALGMEVEDFPTGEGEPYKMLKVNGTPVAGVMDTSAGPAQGAPPHWAVYLAVDDVDARIEKCLAMGAKVVVPAMDVPKVGRMAMIADPNGAHLWLFRDAN